jgi:hypothetical protein
MHLIRKPAKFTGARHELCTWGEPTIPGVSSLSRRRYTQYVERNNRKGRLREQETTRRGPIMEEVMCAMALNGVNGRQKRHTQVGLHTCAVSAGAEKCRRAESTPGVPVRETARAKEVAPRGLVERLCVMRWWRFGCAALCCAGKLLAGNIGSLCEQQAEYTRGVPVRETTRAKEAAPRGVGVAEGLCVRRWWRFAVLLRGFLSCAGSR